MLRLAPASSQFNALILLSPLPLCSSQKFFFTEISAGRSLYLVWKSLVCIIFSHTDNQFEHITFVIIYPANAV